MNLKNLWIKSLNEHVEPPPEQILSDFKIEEPPPPMSNIERTPQQGILSNLNLTAPVKQKKFKLEVTKEEPPLEIPKPVEKQKPRSAKKEKVVNFHHGMKKPFHVEFCFGTNEVFEGFRDPKTPFTIPNFSLSRPEYFRGEVDEMPGPNEICSYQAQLYRVSKDENTNKEFYVDIGTGRIAIQNINNSYILTLNANNSPTSLRLIKGIQPRIKPESYVQIFAEQIPAMEPSIYLIRCASTQNATDFCKSISDCVSIP